MDVRVLNKICFTICIVCIVLGTVLGLAMIWADLSDSQFVWKSWLTIAVLFLASALTLNVSKTFEGRGVSRWFQHAADPEPSERPQEDRFRT